MKLPTSLRFSYPIPVSPTFLFDANILTLLFLKKAAVVLFVTIMPMITSAIPATNLTNYKHKSEEVTLFFPSAAQQIFLTSHLCVTEL